MPRTCLSGAAHFASWWYLLMCKALHCLNFIFDGLLGLQGWTKRGHGALERVAQESLLVANLKSIVRFRVHLYFLPIEQGRPRHPHAFAQMHNLYHKCYNNERYIIVDHPHFENLW